MKQRLKPEDRKGQILAAAVKLAEGTNYTTITRDGVAGAAGVSMGLVTRYFGTMNQLRRAVMRAAVAEGNAVVVAQGLAQRDPQALKAAPELREAAGRKLAAIA